MWDELSSSTDFGYRKSMSEDDETPASRRASERAAEVQRREEERRKRAALKLRENLMRRKSQSRARRAGDADETIGLPAAKRTNHRSLCPKGRPLRQSTSHFGKHCSSGGFRLRTQPFALERESYPTMDRIRITGGNELRGVIPISGAKNAALPLMIASLLTSDTLTLENVPHLADVEQLLRILGNHGVDISVNGRRESQTESYARTIHFTCRTIVDTTAPYELVSKMRASFWVIGPLLAREGRARVSLPGGCAIGTRPVDLFLESLAALGAEIEIDGGYVNVTRPQAALSAPIIPSPRFPLGRRMFS